MKVTRCQFFSINVQHDNTKRVVKRDIKNDAEILLDIDETESSPVQMAVEFHDVSDQELSDIKGVIISDGQGDISQTDPE
ncbi:hypothetical protein [Vibrio barjaei]|uniref:hypothetical protein n=1 Tax=Vibrio barjaei TaxID=1676683 RepID=UPI002283BE89|nr:hypothetical protein [Vibrio barjaei]MCY9872304.1 hypothetical protein [Vibrio barjaei]